MLLSMCVHCPGAEHVVRLLSSAGQVDEEGNSLDFESLLSQLLEVIITIVSNKRFCKLLEPVVPELIYVTIGALKHCFLDSDPFYPLLLHTAAKACGCMMCSHIVS